MEIIKTKPGCLSILAGKTGLGKSTIAVYNAAQELQEGKKVVFFSYEYSQSMIYNKLVVHYDLRWGQLFNIDVVDAKYLPLDNLIEILRLRKDNVDVAYIDYLNLLRECTSKDEYGNFNRFDEVQEIVARLAAIAAELNISIVLLCQEDVNSSLDNTIEYLYSMISGAADPNSVIKMFVGKGNVIDPRIQADDISHIIVVEAGSKLKHFSSINIKELYKD